MRAQFSRLLSWKHLPPGALLCLTLAGSLAAETPVSYPADWSDLERRPIYGSEKEEKLRINALVVEEEDWDEHYALNIFGLFRYTDYPAFSRLSIYPFYSGTESKHDGRHSSWAFPFYYTFTEHGGASVLITPFSLHDRDAVPEHGGERGGFDMIGYLYIDARSGSPEAGGGEHTRALLPFFFHSRDESRNLTALAVAPLFYGRSIENSREDAFQLISLLGYFDETTTRNADGSTVDESFHAGPLYIYSAAQRSGGGTENRRSTFWSPLLPLYFSDHDASGESRRLLANVYYETSSVGELDVLALAPLYLYTRGDDGDAYHVSPFFYYSNSAEHSTAWAPIVPLYYSSDDDAGSTRLYGNVHIRRDAAGDVKQWNAYPFFFYSSVNEEELDAGERGVVAVVPFYHRVQGRGSGGVDTTYTFGLPYFAQTSNGPKYASSSLFTPLGYYDARDDRRDATREQRVSHASPLHVYQRSETPAGVESAFWAPILPLYYTSDSPETGSTRVYGPVFTQFDNRDELERLGALPFFYYSAGENGMLAVVPFYFHNRHRNNVGVDRAVTFGVPYFWMTRNDEHSEARYFLSPVAYYSDSAETKTNGADEQRERHVSPFYYYSDHVEREGLDVAYETSFWAPIVPLYYAADSSRDGSTRLYGPVHTARDKDGELERFVAFPLFFYFPNGPDGNTAAYAPPFYFQTRHARTDSGFEHKSFSLLHYARTDRGGTPEESSTLWAGPYYRSYDRARDEHTSLLAPLYYSWDYPDSEFTLALPAYFSYDDGRRYLHVNASGLSISRQRGLLPTVGRNETNEWYVDQDVALFYSLFRFSTRIVLTGDDAPANTEPDANFAEFDLNDKDRPDVVDDGTPERRRAKDRLATADEQRRDVSRGNARTFWGIQSFYGLVAYERADTRRHFRMLPLSWLTWDEASDNRTMVVPGAFLSHYNESDDTEYFALFPAFVPLYGRQREGDSFLESYLALAYLREYDADEQRSEHSVLWPLANYHSSPDRRGGRILPLVWHSAERDPNAANPDDAWTSLTVAPMFYHRSQPGETSHSLIPVYHAYDKTLYDGSREYRWIALPGLYYRSREHAGDENHTAFNENESWILPLIYDYRYDAEQQTAHRQVSPLHYYATSDTQTHASFAWLGYIYERNDTTESVEHTALWPVANYHSSPQSFGGRILPFFWHRSDRVYAADGSGDDWTRLTVAPLFYHQSEPGHTAHALVPLYHTYDEKRYDGSREYRWLSLPGLYYRSREHEGDAEQTAYRETESWVLPIFYDYRSETARQQTARLQASPLHYYEADDAETYASFAWAGYIYEQNNAAESVEHTALWPLVNYHSSPQSFGGRILPFFWHRADRVDEYRSAMHTDAGAGQTGERWNTTTITPLFYRSHNAAHDSDTLLLPAPGVYTHSSTDASTYSWLGLAHLEFHVPHSERAEESDTADDAVPAAKELSNAHLAPIFFYERGDYFHVAPLYFGFYGSNADATHFGPGYYHSTDAAGAHTNLLLLADLSTSRERGLDRLWLMPVFAHRGYHEDMSYGDSAYTYVAPVYYGYNPQDRTTSVHLLPIAYSWYTPAAEDETSARPAEFTLFAGGLYVRRAGDQARDNFLYLVDRDVHGAYADYGLLLNSVSVKTGPRKLQMNAGYGLLAGLRSENDQFSANVLWAVHEHDAETFHNSFFPLWWYEHERTSASTTWMLAPLLSGGKHSPNESYQLIGGGALYHEFSDTRADVYSQRVLLGAVYENVTRPERGFSARGSLWRYLWEYETESETDYEKFSVLKFVYSRTHHNGRTNYRVLGVRVSES